MIINLPCNMIKCNNSDEYKDEIEVDDCLAEEIKYLLNQNVHTCGCCCGHGNIGFIQVIDEDIKLMQHYGYEKYLYENEFGGDNRNDAFIPKSKCVCRGDINEKFDQHEIITNDQSKLYDERIGKRFD